jgi:hypothetical protein
MRRYEKRIQGGSDFMKRRARGRSAAVLPAHGLPGYALFAKISAGLKNIEGERCLGKEKKTLAQKLHARKLSSRRS